GCNTPQLKVTITDDGDGFHPNRLRDGRSGLAGMRERALLAGGRLEIRSAPGEGTSVELTVRARGTRLQS
ncbi:MAG TPA: ATP-binding protein, partial [Solirubrobacteraceae bacterium]|nr:ATP-binding protein [Solirubrobacteraceae bacterium]